MLLEFRVKNFRSFQDEQVLSLITTGDSSLPDNYMVTDKYQILKAAAIYGPNASGKSNLVRAMAVMGTIVLNSADFKPSDPLPVEPFVLNKRNTIEPTEFEVTFLHQGVRYQYGFSATVNEIIDEWLYAYPNAKSQNWFTRSSTNTWKFSSMLRGERVKLKERTRKNALFVSVGAQWNHKQLTAIYNWFNNVQVVSCQHDWAPITEQLMLSMGDNNVLREVVCDLLRNADLGVDDIKLEPITKDKIELPTNIPEAARDRLFREYIQRHPAEVHFLHKMQETSNTIPIRLSQESDGTQAFFKLIGPWLEATTHGYTIFFDELEAHLHPLLSRMLIEWVCNENSAQNAQLVFTTHDTTLLDTELFRRDQIWFTEKESNGASKLYSLVEYKPRKGEALQKRYLSGRYGAIPVLEAFSKNG